MFSQWKYLPMAFKVKSEYAKIFFVVQFQSRFYFDRILIRERCTGTFPPRKYRLWICQRIWSWNIIRFRSAYPVKRKRMKVSACVDRIFYGMNVGDRVTRIRCVPVKRCSAERDRKRERQKEKERGGTPPGATRRDAEVLHRYIRESRSRRSRDSLRCCLMRFGIRRNLEIPRTNTVVAPGARIHF